RQKSQPGSFHRDALDLGGGAHPGGAGLRNVLRSLNDMLIRPLKPHDQSEWLRLRRILWPACSEAMHLREMEEYANSAGARAVFVMVREDGRLGGFAEVSLRDRVDGSMSARVASLDGGFVARDPRGKVLRRV